MSSSVHFIALQAFNVLKDVLSGYASGLQLTIVLCSSWSMKHLHFVNKYACTAPGGVCSGGCLRVVSAPGDGGYIPACTEADTPL